MLPLLPRWVGVLARAVIGETDASPATGGGAGLSLLAGAAPPLIEGEADPDCSAVLACSTAHGGDAENREEHFPDQTAPNKLSADKADPVPHVEPSSDSQDDV